MDNRMYSGCSCQSDPEFGEAGTKISLDKLKLAKGQKFTLHYDFGDDWMFPISVVKIEQVDQYQLPRIIKSKGSISIRFAQTGMSGMTLAISQTMSVKALGR